MTDAAIDPQTILDSFGRLIQRLKSELGEAELLDRNSVSEPTDQGRCGAMYALTAVISFLDALGCEDDGLQVRPLTRLFEALQDTDNGKAHPMFVPKKLSHRPPDSVELRELKIQSALAMQLLMDSGLTKDKAASDVAKLLCKESIIFPAASPFGEPTKETVAGWRNSLLRSPRFRNRLSAIQQQTDVSQHDKPRNALVALRAFIKGMSGHRKHTPSFLTAQPILDREKPPS